MSSKAARTVQTTYYGPDGREVQVNLAVHSRSAVLRALDHMQMNTYGAITAEVFDTQTAALHAIVTRHISEIGTVTISYQRNPQAHK